MSRPTASVPSRNWALPPATHAGGVSVNSRYCSFGGCGATTLAPTANRTSNTINPRPISAPRLCAYAFLNSCHELGTTSVAPSAAAASGISNSRIDHAIEQVDQQVDRDHDRRD